MPRRPACGGGGGEGVPFAKGTCGWSNAGLPEPGISAILPSLFRPDYRESAVEAEATPPPSRRLQHQRWGRTPPPAPAAASRPGPARAARAAGRPARPYRPAATLLSVTNDGDALLPCLAAGNTAGEGRRRVLPGTRRCRAGCCPLEARRAYRPPPGAQSCAVPCSPAAAAARGTPARAEGRRGQHRKVASSRGAAAEAQGPPLASPSRPGRRAAAAAAQPGAPRGSRRARGGLGAAPRPAP